jgi:hypothetical protein
LWVAGAEHERRGVLNTGAGEGVGGNEIDNPEIAKWDPAFTKQVIKDISVIE